MSHTQRSLQNVSSCDKKMHIWNRRLTCGVIFASWMTSLSVRIHPRRQKINRVSDPCLMKRQFVWRRENFPPTSHSPTPLQLNQQRDFLTNKHNIWSVHRSFPSRFLPHNRSLNALMDGRANATHDRWENPWTHTWTAHMFLIGLWSRTESLPGNRKVLGGRDRLGPKHTKTQQYTVRELGVTLHVKFKGQIQQKQIRDHGTHTLYTV